MFLRAKDMELVKADEEARNGEYMWNLVFVFTVLGVDHLGNVSKIVRCNYYLLGPPPFLPPATAVAER